MDPLVWKVGDLVIHGELSHDTPLTHPPRLRGYPHTPLTNASRPQNAPPWLTFEGGRVYLHFAPMFVVVDDQRLFDAFCAGTVTPRDLATLFDGIALLCELQLTIERLGAFLRVIPQAERDNLGSQLMRSGGQLVHTTVARLMARDVPMARGGQE